MENSILEFHAANIKEMLFSGIETYLDELSCTEFLMAH